MLGLAIAAFLALGYWRYRVNKIPGAWTPERSAMWRAAMRYERNPAKLMELARHFQDEGFPDKAFPLRTRAMLVHMSPAERRQVAPYGSSGGGGRGRYRGFFGTELGSSWALFGRDRKRPSLTRGPVPTTDQIMRRALSSGRPDAIHRVAVGFENTGRGACAEFLKSYARGLEVAGELNASGLNVGHRFGIGTVIPSQYVPPSPPPAPPSPPPTASSSSDNALRAAAYNLNMFLATHPDLGLVQEPVANFQIAWNASDAPAGTSVGELTVSGYLDNSTKDALRLALQMVQSPVAPNFGIGTVIPSQYQPPPPPPPPPQDDGG